MKTVLFVAQLETQFNTEASVAQWLNDSGQYRPIFYFDRAADYQRDRMIKRCQSEGWEFFSSPTRTDPPWWKIFERIPTALLKYLRHGIEFVQDWHHLHRLDSNARDLINRRRPDLIILGEDGVGGNNAIIKYGRQSDVRSLSLPYEYSTISQHLDEVLFYPSSPRVYGMDNAINRWVARRYPSWAHVHNHRTLLRQRGTSILVQEWLRIAPPKPWTVHGGSADALAVESQQMMHHYLADDLPQQKLVMTGSVFDDALAATVHESSRLRGSLISTWGLDPARPLLLAGLPPDFTYRPTANFSNFRDLLSFWIQTMRSLRSFNVVFHAHPAIPSDMLDYIRSLKAPLTDQSIATLIPLADAFVVSNSSTIRWAVGCGLPVVNYDVYRFQSRDFDAAPGVMTVNSRKDFSSLLRRLDTDADYFNQQREKQRSVMADWGMFDGHSKERIFGLINSLTNHRPGHD